MSDRGVPAAVCAVLVLLAFGGCGGDSNGDDELARFARSVSAAYHCMPPQTRGEYDRLGRRLERIGSATLARYKDRPPEEQDRALRADPRYVRLSVRASKLLARYLPRGSDFEPACYRRESRRHARRAGALDSE
jgi:hypothetical protein